MPAWLVKWLAKWFDATILDLARQFHWSFLPPLMVYFAFGVSGLTAIVGAFFVKEYLGLSASFLAGLAFWAGLPWALKMPVGHMVDVFWRWKALLVYVGAGLIAASLLIMYALIRSPDAMAGAMPVEAWFVMATLLAPSGFVLQDAVADAMSVEAVPTVDAAGRPLGEVETKALHTTMQTLGRIALIIGLVAVAVLNIVMFEGVDTLDPSAKAEVYGRIYLIGLAIPAISVSGVLLAAWLKHRRRGAMRASGLNESEIARRLEPAHEKTAPNAWYFGGGAAFVALTLLIGLADPPLAQELVFIGSMAVVGVLMARLARELSPDRARMLFGTAIIIFIFRAVPRPGPGATWFEIDVLGFDQQFLSVLTLLTSVLALVGMVILRPLMAARPITFIVALLTIVGGLLQLPNIGLYYGLHEWTAPLTAGVVDARFIAVLDTAIESPLAQVAMIPMLAWIAKNAPPSLKATFFAVIASFTNLALSASSLLTKYLNQFFVVTREVRDAATGEIEIAANYDDLGALLIAAAIITVAAPFAAILVIQNSSLRTTE